MARGGSGNAAWKAAAIANQIQPGRRNRRQCTATAKGSGQRCRNIAVSNVATCRLHGGKGLLTQLKMRERARRHVRITEG
jgi:hypothetical protein